MRNWRSWSAADDTRLRNLVGEYTRAGKKVDWHHIAKELDRVSAASVRMRWRDGGLTTEDSDSTTDSLVADRPLTVDDLLKKTKVDLTQWEVERFVINKWEIGAKHTEMEMDYKNGVANGHINKKGVTVTPLYQIKVWFKKHPAAVETARKLAVGLLEDIRKEAKGFRWGYVKPGGVPDGEWLFEFSPFDLHMGKYTWAEETVSDYDADMAADLFNASLDFLLAKALRLTNNKLDRVLCVFGNDAMHTDSKRNQTTAGTQMDFDSRYVRIFRRLVQVHRRAVERLREHAPVDIVIIPGNHDEHTAFHLGEILTTVYEGVKGVTVDNSAKLRKYYDYGTNLFGFTHGDAESVKELPLLMAREVPDRWARCESREWHIGHKHISEKWTSRERLEQDFFSDKGVRVRRLTSLSAHDAWHTKHAYTDRRACEAFIFHKTAGFTDHLSFNVDHFTGKALSK